MSSGLPLFFCSISTSFLCSSDNAAWWLNGQCSPSSNTEDPLASVQYNNRKDQREKRKGNSETAMKDSKAGGRACVRESLLLSFDQVEAFPAHCASEEITSDTLCHRHYYIFCKKEKEKKTRKEKTHDTSILFDPLTHVALSVLGKWIGRYCFQFISWLSWPRSSASIPVTSSHTHGHLQ